jgi:hypothetical protein
MTTMNPEPEQTDSGAESEGPGGGILGAAVDSQGWE